LQIGIHGHDDLSGGGIEAGRKGRGFAEVASQAHDSHVHVGRVQPDELAIGAVRRTVVDEDELPVEFGFGERRRHLGVERRERRLLVEKRDDDGDKRLARAAPAHGDGFFLRTQPERDRQL